MRAHRLGLTLGILVALALAVIVPSGASAAWSPGPAFGAGADAAAGDVAGGADGSLTAWWRTGDGTLLVQHTRPGGALAAPVALGAAKGAVAAAVAPDGSSAVAWVADDGSAVRLTVLDAGGAHVRTVDAGSLAGDDADDGSLGVGVATGGSGAVTVAWQAKDVGSGEVLVHAARVAPDGAVGAPVPLGSATGFSGLSDVPAAAAAPDGTAWVAWVNNDNKLVGARLTAGGAVDRAAAVLSDTPTMGAPRLVASAAGAVVVWPSGNGFNMYDMNGVRLPATGIELVRGTLTTGDPSAGWLHNPGDPDAYGAAIGPDGAVTIVWQDMVPTGPTTLAETVWSARFAPGFSTAGRQKLQAGVGPASFFPAVGAAADGTVLATWVEANPTTHAAALAARRFGPDGTTGATEQVAALTSQAFPFVTASPTAIAVATGGGGTPWSATTYVATTPPGGPGTPPGAGPPAAVPPPGPHAGGGPAATPKRASRLKVAKATRKGAKVTVSGTISTKANGLKVRVTYAQKVGRKTVKVHRTAKVRKGRWSVTLKLPSKLRHGRAARAKGTVTATFAGTKTIKKATAKRTVRFAKARSRR